MPINVPFVFDSNNESYGTLQNFNNIVTAVNTELTDNYDSNVPETISRIIYVSNTGNDETGDGSVELPYASINKAVSTIKSILNNYSNPDAVVITIQLEAGNFIIDKETAIICSKFKGNGTLKFIGTLVSDITGLTCSATSEVFLYDVTSEGSPMTWTGNEHKRKYVKIGSNYFPVHSNDVSQIEYLSTSTTGTEIYFCGTTITWNSDIILDINLILQNLSIDWVDDIYLSVNPMRFVEVTNCSFYSATNDHFYFNCYLQIYRSSFIGAAIFNYVAEVYGTSFYINSSSINCIDVYARGALYLGVATIIENPLKSGVYVTNGILTDIATITSNIKFKNCVNALQPHNNVHIFFNSQATIHLVNVDYFARKFGSQAYEGECKFLIKSNIIGAPNIRWSYDSLNELINPNINRYFYINNALYPEFESNLSSNLVNNTSTNIIIGDVSQNISCKVDYTISRSLGFRSGNFSIITDSSNSYISSDIFVTNANSIVDSSAISFSTDISNGKYIMMNVTQNDYADASLFYNVSRVMKTPLII